MAIKDLQVAFEERIREIVQPMLDEVVNGAAVAFLGITRGVSRPRVGRPRKEAAAAAAPKEACNVAGCVRPMRSKGYCAAHYQSARKYGWPMPAPGGFQAPVRRRGRPPKGAASAPASKAARKQGRRRGRRRGRKVVADAPRQRAS